jgi:hypothetical protein
MIACISLAFEVSIRTSLHGVGFTDTFPSFPTFIDSILKLFLMSETISLRTFDVSIEVIPEFFIDSILFACASARLSSRFLKAVLAFFAPS